jgi:hypothetical protein
VSCNQVAFISETSAGRQLHVYELEYDDDDNITSEEVSEIGVPEGHSFTNLTHSLRICSPYLAVLLQSPHGIRVGLYHESGDQNWVFNPAQSMSSAWTPAEGHNTVYLGLTQSHLLINLTTCVLILDLSTLPSLQEGEWPEFTQFPSRSMGMDSPSVHMATACRLEESSQLPPVWFDGKPAAWMPEGDAKVVLVQGPAALASVEIISPLVVLDATSTSIVPWSDTMTEQRFTSCELV